MVEKDIYPWIYEELEKKGWKTHDKSQVREEVRVGKKRADILLNDNKGEPLGVIEVKDEGTKPYSAKMQAKEYAKGLGAPFVFLTDGDELYFWELDTGFDAHPVKTFLTQDDLIRKRVLLENRKDLEIIPIDSSLVGGITDGKDWSFQVDASMPYPMA